MKRMILGLWGVVCLLSATAQTPQLINYQGRLVNGTNLVNGSVGLSLRLFDASSGGTKLYEDSNTVTVADGLYATLIGDNTTFGQLQTALESTNVWVEVAVNNTALTPRERLVAAAYAVKSRVTEVFTGAVTDSQLSTNIPRLNAANQTFSGPVSFTSASNTFTGTFSGDGGGLAEVPLSALVTNQPTLVAWGDLEWGQVGAFGNPTGITAIAAGNRHGIALRDNGTVMAWGDNSYGQTNVPAAATGVVAIAAGDDYSIALRGNGTVVAWGRTNLNRTAVPPTATGVIAVAAGYTHGLALRGNGTVVTWGESSFGLTNVPPTATGVVAIAAGHGFCLAVRSDGVVIAWGDNTYGQRNVPPTATGVVAIAAGYGHCLAARGDGAVIAWGDNFGGQTNVPATATGVVAVAAGDLHSLA